MLVVPLAICANVSSLSAMRLASAGLMAFLTTLFFLAGMIVASVNGCVFTVLIRPGVHNRSRSLLPSPPVSSPPPQPPVTPLEAIAALSNEGSSDEKLELDKTVISIVHNLVPDNLFRALFSQSQVNLNVALSYPPLSRH